MIGSIIAALGGAAFSAVGIGAIAAPAASSKQYGLPTDDPAALAFVRAVGVRDLVLGLIVIGLVARRDRAALGLVLGASILAAIGDGAAVVSARPGAGPRDIAVHAGGAAALATAWVLVRNGW